MNNSRALLITIIFFCCFCVLVAKLFTIQISEYDKYSAIAERQQNCSSTIIAERGVISDRSNNVLAYTRNEISLFVDKRMLSDEGKNALVEKLSQVFGKDKSHYLRIIDRGKNNICLEKKVAKADALQFDNMYVNGFFKKEDHTRVYPYHNLAAHILGYVDKNCIGQSGIEKVSESYLKGTNGLRYIENDVVGRVVSINNDLSRPAKPGDKIELTIDMNYQSILEEELSEGLKKYEGETATGIIMDPNSGAILALANLPDYDPEKYNVFSDNERRNRAITDTYEPGSTIKPIVMAMMMENGLVKENDLINTENGSYKVRGAVIHDTHKFESLTARQVLEQSSNIGMAKLSERMNSDMFYKCLRDFGFGNSTGIELLGEVNGFLKKPKSYSAISKKFISHGYEISATPLQLLSAFNSLINGGILYKPYVVKRISNYKGEIVEEFEPKKIRRTVSELTSEKIKDFMVGVVEEGTGIKARLTNVLVGGKTGTSQILKSTGYSNRDYNSSFVGFLPADNPKVACLVLVKAPKIGRYGGQVAAPIFKEIAEKIVDADINIVPSEMKIERKEDAFDDFLFTVKQNRENENSMRSANLPSGKDAKEDLKDKKKTLGRMPKLEGVSIREAIKLLSAAGIKCKVVGNGRVVSQSIAPGSTIKSGTECLLKCESSNKLNKIRIH